ncbi:hypothetical protein DL95DRAFT_468582 [Leptodontidium sp. 2 PMI_412]|nr:hypothetical protein DL95DRAFT_468582 [Leptodontidium sp. 2 PMI_412]
MAFMNLLRFGAAIPPQYPITTRSVFGGQPSERSYGILEVLADCNMHSEHSGCPENYFCYMHTCIYYPPNTPPPGCGDGRKGLWRSGLQIKIAEDSGQHESQYSSQDPRLDEPKMSLSCNDDTDCPPGFWCFIPYPYSGCVAKASGLLEIITKN